MSNELIQFEFETSSLTIRVVEIDGEPWFVAKDVAEALEYAYWQPNLVSCVPDEWKGINPINTLGGTQELWCLSEQGLYLPALRKRGHYGVLNPTERLRYLTALSKTAQQLEGAKNPLSQTLLIQSLEEIYAMLRLKMPAITLVQAPAAQMKLTTDEERSS